MDTEEIGLSPGTQQEEKTESNKTRATKFEEEIKQFLVKLGFIDVDGATDRFKLGGIQVDSCGGHLNSTIKRIQHKKKKRWYCGITLLLVY
ncbi:MAG: hypothetical protein ABSD46_07695 [Bacteroidota bacterium]